MKISYNWLKDYLNLDVSPEVVSRVLTDTGLEVEGTHRYESIPGGLRGVVVGQVLTCHRHENADKLSVTTVDIGNNVTLPIVCGAPNVAAGQKVLVATVGTTLYSGDDSFEIKKAKIRGEVSEGMICAEDELGLGTSHDGIIVLPDDTETGKQAAELFKVEVDVVFEIGLTPNRSDATSHIGVARDLAAGLNREFGTAKYRLTMPEVEKFKVDNHSLDIQVEVLDHEACPRYSGVTLSGISVTESPDWLKQRLERIGVRPINNIVDVTNYVLHETGQPLHAFDAAKVSGHRIMVQKLPDQTSFTTLDEAERKLSNEDLMICNADNGMCIAGVFGGLTSGVTDSTSSIFLESASFDARHIRKTAKRHTLQTDASFRFERGVDPNITVYALKRAILLMQQVGGGQVSSAIKDIYPEPVTPVIVDLSYENTDRLIGKVIDREVIKAIITDLQIDILSESNRGLQLSIPTFKVDVTREVDVIEEILRIYGINNIEIDGKLHAALSHRQKPDMERVKEQISTFLTGQGLTEIMNNSLTKASYTEWSSIHNSEEQVMLLNPLSKDLNALRQSLLFGGLEVVSYNLNRKVKDLKIFEFGKVYQKKSADSASKKVSDFVEEQHLLLMATGSLMQESWNATEKAVDFYTLKGWVEAIFTRLRLDRKQITVEAQGPSDLSDSLSYRWNGQVVASVGKVKKKLQEEFDIKQPVWVADINWTLVVKLFPKGVVSYEPVSKFPSVRRDLAVLLDKTVSFEQISEAAYKAERKLLKNVDVFDVYVGDRIPADKKSYALAFILEDREKTMTDKVIEKTMARIQQTLERECGAVLR